MHKRIFITGTGTDIGKTIVSTILARGLRATYWKPIQCGTPYDFDFVACWHTSVAKSAYVFEKPMSPHAAGLVDLSHIFVPVGDLVIEGAGGVLVPLNDDFLMIDLIQKLEARPLIVASSLLGTINHTLLTLEALRSRRLEPIGVILVGPENISNRDAIAKFGKTRVLGTIPFLGTRYRLQEHHVTGAPGQVCDEFSSDWFDQQFSQLEDLDA